MSDKHREIAKGVVNQIAVGAWQFCSRLWVIGLVEQALKDRDERAAKIARSYADLEPWYDTHATEVGEAEAIAIAIESEDEEDASPDV